MVTFKKQKGFSLIEIIVAFSIAVMSLAVLYNIQSNAVRSSILYDEYLIANRIGASLLAEASVQMNKATEGSYDNKYFWEISTTDYVSNSETSQPINNLALSNVTLKIEWQSIDRERSILLNTLKPKLTQSESDF
ncbi:MAG: hypothetical protein CMP91_11110 [Gammaproteobacteria bacterium]|nr:hypothetical protein [Gammaproteobacteria bacterium]|tara:strand:- start:5475 stop:5879 length:405 start_codon:yes stop_codon:yes gene_type:complete